MFTLQSILGKVLVHKKSKTKVQEEQFIAKKEIKVIGRLTRPD